MTKHKNRSSLQRGGPNPNSPQKLRCAIYTRKSSEEGLEQEFNSLDAQREACAAFILSQKHEGWEVIDSYYDDGGISGGTMQRPALKRLLHDIEAGKVDSVIVYKVDRLSRSLSDFVRMVEVFDNKGVSFVSVTQQFNTTTSMGRLTLNMLLSFAQFEREVTGERIRDKIAASKQKGMWMGGLPPLGYNVDDRKLVINQKEANTVNHIYRRYLELGSVRLLKEDLDRNTVISKKRINRHGRRSGGKSFARGALYLMLSNRVYLGEIVHKDKHYPGEHEQIIETQLWDQVQNLLKANRVTRKSGANAHNPSLLAGLIYDDEGERMTPTHARKKDKTYRYYISRKLVSGKGTSNGQSNGWSNPKGRRLPAGDIEGLVERYIVQMLKRQSGLHNMLEPTITNALERQSLVTNASQLAAKWPRLGASAKRIILNQLVARIDIKPDSIALQICPHQLPNILRGEDAQSGNRSIVESQIDADIDADSNADTTGNAEVNNPAVKESESGTINVSLPAKLKRAGLETKLVIDADISGSDNTLSLKAPDPYLHKLIAKAHEFQAIFLRGGKTITAMAEEAGVSGSYFTRTLRYSFLSPDITKAIIAGRQPVQLTTRKLLSYPSMPTCWNAQKSLLEFI